MSVSITEDINPTATPRMIHGSLTTCKIGNTRKED